MTCKNCGYENKLVFDIANGVVNTLSLNEHWHKK